MRKLILLLALQLLCISCSSESDKYSGKWIDKSKELDVVNIEKNSDNFIVTLNKQKYPAKLKDGLLEISMGIDAKATLDQNDELIILGSEYIRYEKALRPKYLGKWNNSGFVIEITDWGKQYMKVKAIKGSWAREYKIASYEYKDGKIQFKDRMWDNRINYFILEDDGRLKQTINGSQFNYYEKIE